MINFKHAKAEATYEIVKDIPLDRLEAICNAERDGRLIVLPCVDNREIYVILDGKIEKAFIWNISVSYTNEDRIVYECLLVHRNHDNCLLSIKQFKKIWFLSRKEAEKALKGESHEKR